MISRRRAAFLIILFLTLVAVLRSNIQGSFYAIPTVKQQLGYTAVSSVELLLPPPAEQHPQDALIGTSGSVESPKNDTQTEIHESPTEREEDDLLPALPVPNSLPSRVVVFELGHFTKYHGLGSIVMFMLQFQAFYGDTQNRTLILDQSRFTFYRRNSTHGLFSGILQIQPHTISNMIVLDQDNRALFNNLSSSNAIRISHVKYNLWMISLKKQKTAQDYLRKQKQQQQQQQSQLYNRLAPLSCYIEMTPQTKQQALDCLSHASIPSFETHQQPASVAFHIRRSDKVTSGESRAFSAREYVTKLVQALHHENTTITTPANIEHCYVATDDARVLTQLKQELQEVHIPCQIHTLARTVQNYGATRMGAKAYLALMADLHQLTTATLFVGTFNSNVGRLVAMWRSCHRPVSQSYHYYHSYGVDGDEIFN